MRAWLLRKLVGGAVESFAARLGGIQALKSRLLRDIDMVLTVGDKLREVRGMIEKL